MKVGLLFGLGVAALGACSSFDTAGDGATGGTTDGGFLPDGAPAPLTGTPFADLDLAFDVPRITHGTTVDLAFTLTRGNFYNGNVVVSVKGLPPTITATDISLNAAGNAGTLTIIVGKDQAQGVLSGITIEADGDSGVKPHVAKPFAPFIRGLPGELDTTFANNGVLTVGGTSLGSEFDVDDTGRILVMNDTSLRRFDADGKSAEAGFNVTFPTERGVLVTHRGDSIFVARNNAITNVSWGGWLSKITSTGTKDPAYGGSAGGAQSAGFAQTAFGIDVDGRAVAFSPTAQPASMVRRVPASGTNLPSPTDLRHPQMTRAAIYLSDHSVVVAGDNYLAKLLPDNSTLDNGFGSSGFVTLDSSLRINDALVDAGGRILVTGVGPTGALFLERVSPSGTIDAVFSAGPSAYVAKTELLLFPTLLSGDYSVDFAGRVTLDSDSNILQAGQLLDGSVTKCAVIRYSKDGIVDSTFGTNGLAKIDVPGCYAHRIYVQSDGRVIVGGPVIMRVWN